MKFDGFSIHAQPFIMDAYCKIDRARLVEVSNGFLSSALFCPKCEAVYLLRMVKLHKSKVTPEFLEQCREEVAAKKLKL